VISKAADFNLARLRIRLLQPWKNVMSSPIVENIKALDQIQTTAIDLAFTFGPKLLVACLILLAGYYVGRWMGRITEGMLLKMELDVTLRICWCASCGSWCLACSACLRYKISVSNCCL
jgi:hypothetical protein